MPTIALLNQAGKKVKDITLSEEIFGIEPNQQVIYDVVNAQRAAMRQGTHDTLVRHEVAGGGKKPWRQKGTGRARQGSIRAPQWRGGGTVFGPHPRKYDVKVNKKVRQLGLKSALSYKVLNNKLVAVDTIKFDAIKTKDFIAFLNNIDANGKTLVLVKELDVNTALSARNLQTVFVNTAEHSSVYDILCYDKLVMTSDAISYFEEALK